MGSRDLDRAVILAAEHAEEGDRSGRLADDVVAAITTSGLLRQFVPTAFGGDQGAFTACVEPLLRLSQADPSAGWCAALMTSASRMAAYLPPDGQRTLWADSADTPIAATLQPAGTATPATSGGQDGWTLTGRWPFVSSAEHCRWALLSTTTRASGDGGDGGGERRFMLVPRSAWTVEPTWNNMGLRATGSHTLRLGRTHVPAAHTFTRQDLFDGSSPAGQHLRAACHAVPHEAVSGLFFAVPLLGAAMRFLDTYLNAEARRDPSADTVIGFAAGQIDAARLLLQHAAATADTTTPDAARTVRLRLHYATVARLATAAANQLFAEAGVRATSNANPLQRLWRDVNTAAQHPVLNLASPSADHAAAHRRATP